MGSVILIDPKMSDVKKSIFQEKKIKKKTVKKSTVPSARTLVSEKFRRSRWNKGASQNSFFVLNLKSQIWLGSFREYSKSSENG